MRAAYEAAIAAVGNSDPNPAVGAIVVSQSGEILSHGATQRAGFAHAERQALNRTGNVDLTNSTIYLTLEPCCHHGRTPPCVDAIIERKLGRVVISERDFAAEVMGRSVELLRAQGVSVSILDSPGFSAESWLTTGPFFFARQFQRPRVTLKWAQTRDGAIAPSSGPSGPISGSDAAFMTAALRNIHKFTLASPGAVRHDAPRLNLRFAENTPDFAESGLSGFFKDLILTQPDAVAGLNRKGQTQFKSAARGFLGAEMNPLQRAEFHARQTALGGDFHTFAFLSSEWRADFSSHMAALLSEILRLGYNSVLIEAGPQFSELLLRHDFVDAIALYRSLEKTAQGLWREPGKGNSFSVELATGTPAGFELLEKARFTEDEFFFFRRRR